MNSRRVVSLSASLLLVMASAAAYAHCDSLSGPVAVDARKALETGDFQPIQVWVGADQEAELRRRFEECRTVRKTPGPARDLADRYFIETAIRLHREAEGMPFTGIKPAQPLPPDIAAAEKALEQEDVTVITDTLKEEVEQQTAKWFDQALQARRQKDQSVEAGRHWVDAYVKYVIYVHGLHQKIQAGPAHGVGE